VLAALPFVPPGPARPNSPDRNKAIAQAIVRFRDGDLLHGILPHGPFQNIFELNLVPGFRDALGDPYTARFTTEQGVLTPEVIGSFESKFLILNRISNLITTRSDSYTVYVIVQGFRNAGTPNAQLVVQRRAAYIADRSPVTPRNRVMSVTNVPAN